MADHATRHARDYRRRAGKLVETAACSGRSRICPPDRLTQVDHRYRPPHGQAKKRDGQRKKRVSQVQQFHEKCPSVGR
jgi:hypothetical protein